jgi:hypothetical protein
MFRVTSCVKFRFKSRVEPPPSEPVEAEKPGYIEQSQTRSPTAQPVLAGFVIATIIGMITLAAFMYE